MRQELAGAQRPRSPDNSTSAPNPTCGRFPSYRWGRSPLKWRCSTTLPPRRVRNSRKLAAVARDHRQVDSARRTQYANITAGIAYGTMTPINNMSSMADGRDNVGFVVEFQFTHLSRKARRWGQRSREPSALPTPKATRTSRTKPSRRSKSSTSSQSPPRSPRAVPLEVPPARRERARVGNERLPGRQSGLPHPHHRPARTPHRACRSPGWSRAG